MITMLELAISAIGLSWLVMIVGIAVVYMKIDREHREIMRIKKKIDFHEESIKKISGLFVSIKSDQNTA